MGVPEMITADQHCFRDLMFFSVDTENMENISANHCHLQDAFLVTCREAKSLLEPCIVLLQ